jgi:hypothetical protein
MKNRNLSKSRLKEGINITKTNQHGLKLRLNVICVVKRLSSNILVNKGTENTVLGSAIMN